ncbi:MAG: glycerol-3-phosphate dehydrogenase [Denitrovibrio sp.]|nr:MAG: glycerol-3-phosphate dehydrogenase [Denitrovibrio sp.]
MQDKMAVIGAGSWGTALAELVASNGIKVEMFAFEEDLVRDINEKNENTVFLPGQKLSENISAKTFDQLKTLDTDRVIWVVPTQFSRRVATEYKDAFTGRKVLIATKGIEVDTGDLIVHVLRDCFDAEFSILSGPSFAKEVAAKKPTAVSIASPNENDAKWWQKALSADFFRAYYIDDVAGVEVGGAIKNVIAIATGIADGLGFGYNARAALITRGLAEIARLGVAVGGKPETFMGLSGMGDLVLTCTGDLSRNRTVGLKIAEGMTLEEITGSMKMVAEGVYTTMAAKKLAERLGVDTPIINEVFAILYLEKKPYDSVATLMGRPLKSEKLEG